MLKGQVDTEKLTEMLALVRPLYKLNFMQTADNGLTYCRINMKGGQKYMNMSVERLLLGTILPALCKMRAQTLWKGPAGFCPKDKYIEIMTEYAVKIFSDLNVSPLLIIYEHLYLPEKKLSDTYPYWTSVTPEEHVDV